MAAAVGPSGTSLYQGVEKSSFGFKLLENLGWKEGDGLGAKKQGIKEHVKVKKKYDALGVGAAEQVHRNRDWTTGMMSYDMILSGLKEISNKRAADATSDHSSSGSDDDSASESASASESESSDDEQPAPPKAKRHKPTQAAAKHSKRKAAASSSSSSSSGSDTSSPGSDSEAEAASSSESDSSSSDSDADAPATAAARTAKLATHVGRYRRREAAKHVRGYSATDLAAILGASAEEVTPPAAAAHAAASEPSSSDGRDSSDSSDSGGSSEERMRPATPSLEAPHSGSSGRAEQPQTGAAASSGDKDGAQMPERKWWGSVFVSAGRMGSKGSALRPAGDAKPKVTVKGFSEQDQTNLYMQAHDGKTQNRQGLGRSEMPKKVGGVRWAGTKTKIGDSSDEEEDAEDEQARQQRQEEEESAAEMRAAAEEVAAGIVIIMPKQRKAAGPAAPAPAAAAGATASAAPEAAVGTKAEPVKGKKRKAASNDTEQQAAKKSKKQSNVQQALEKQQQQQQQQQPAQHAEPLAAGNKEKRFKSKAAANILDQQPVATAAAAAIAIPVPVPAPAPAAAAKAAGPSTAGKDIKWRKVALRILAAAPKRRMRARKLLKLALEAAGLGNEAEGQLQHMLGTLRRSASKFDVSEKFVSLVAES